MWLSEACIGENFRQNSRQQR